MNELMVSVLAAAREAGRRIMEIYEHPDRYEETRKADESPLTAADMASHDYLEEVLAKLLPGVPVLSEESAEVPFAQRCEWDRYWLVDPLDGTREFLARNDEFTVNVALVEDHAPVLGVVYAPALDEAYCAALGEGAWKQVGELPPVRIRSRLISTGDVLKVATSRHHRSPDEGRLLATIEKHIGPVEAVSVGSSLKMCLIAEGRADFYPRFGPTMEWDTAAAQIVVQEAGGHLLNAAGEPLLYNMKPELLNPAFFVMGDQPDWWLRCL